MKIRPHLLAHARTGSKCGAALLLSLLILLVLVAIVIQINVSTGTDARIARNDVAQTTMDLAAESALLQVVEMLKTDADAESSATTGAPGAASATGQAGATNPASATGATGAAGAAGAPGGQAAAQPCDSHRDEWANPQRTEINDIKLRIICQDENSKYNILNMLNPDEKEAQSAFDRVVRILDACREGTQFDIDARTAEEMAKVMLDGLVKRKQSKLPRPKLLTDDEKKEDVGLPLTLREFMPLVPFEELHFKDFRDSDGKVVHSITSFLTVWSSLSTAPVTAKSSSTTTGKAGSSGSSTNSNTASKGTSATSGSSTSGRAGTKTGSNTQAGSTSESAYSISSNGTAVQGAGTAANGASGANGAAGTQAGASPAGTSTAASTTGGYGVNVNTAPIAVLKSLFDDRDVSSRFWDKVVEYRNLEDEEEKEKAKEQAKDSGTTEDEVKLDEYGQPMITRRIFSSIGDLAKVDGYGDLSAESQAKVNAMLTTQSEVFSVYVVARKSTAADSDANLGASPAEMRKREETTGDALLRVIHAVYWRHKAGDETKVTPIMRWETLDYLPYEVLDFPPDDR